MKDKLPEHIWKNELGTVNLDNTSGNGTYWVYNKRLYNTV